MRTSESQGHDHEAHHSADADLRGAQPHETPKERVDRELGEALEEIRVALPGVELLLGFLLVLPFSERFELLGPPQRSVYLVCFFLTAFAVALLIAPAAAHRLGFRRLDKLKLLREANRYVIAALSLVAVAIALAAFLVSSLLMRTAWAGVLAGIVALWFAVLWFVIPRFSDHANPAK